MRLVVVLGSKSSWMWRIVHVVPGRRGEKERTRHSQPEKGVVKDESGIKKSKGRDQGVIEETEALHTSAGCSQRRRGDRQRTGSARSRFLRQ